MKFASKAETPIFLTFDTSLELLFDLTYFHCKKECAIYFTFVQLLFLGKMN